MLWLCILPSPLDGPVDGPGLQRLGWWAHQWSSVVSIREPLKVPRNRARSTQDGPGETPEHAVLWIEIGASLALFGGVSALLQRIGAALRELGCRAPLGVAPTPSAALLRARAGCAEPCLDNAALARSWRRFRLRWLALPEATLQALTSSGLTRIDEVLQLPDAAIARRFGPETSRYLQRLQGREPEPLTQLELPAQYRSRHEFDTQIRHSTALLFPLQRMLGEFAGYLSARDRAVQNFTVRLEHSRQHNTPVHIGLAQPGRSAAQLLLLLRERLERLTLTAPVRAVRIEALRFTMPTLLQGDLFARDAELQQQLLQTCDRLRARLGPDALLQPCLKAAHLPEQAFAYLSTDAAAKTMPPHAPAHAASVAAALPVGYSARPHWLLPEPQPLTAPPTLLAGPERIESGWWQGVDATRDYFIARDAQGTRLWVFCDLRDGRWYLQGLWS